MDSQRDLSRSLLKAKLLQQANGGALTTIDNHLGRPFTDQEVDTYADHTLGEGHIHFGAKGLTRTLEGALHPLTGDIPYLKHVVSAFNISTLEWVSHCVHGDRNLKCPPRNHSELIFRLVAVSSTELEEAGKHTARVMSMTFHPSIGARTSRGQSFPAAWI